MEWHLARGIGWLPSAKGHSGVPSKSVRDSGVILRGAGSSQVATPIWRDRWTSQCGKSLWRPSGCCRGQRPDYALPPLVREGGIGGLPSVESPYGAPQVAVGDSGTTPLGAAAASHNTDQASTSGDPT